APTASFRRGAGGKGALGNSEASAFSGACPFPSPLDRRGRPRPRQHVAPSSARASLQRLLPGYELSSSKVSPGSVYARLLASVLRRTEAPRLRGHHSTPAVRR